MAERMISYITGMEPMREREFPVVYAVGSLAHGGQRVTRIDYEIENFGDHGIGWFFVHGEGGLIAKMQARAVAEVFYRPVSSDG